MTHAPTLGTKRRSPRGALPQASPLSHTARGLLAWAAERFPASHLPLFAALYLVAVLHTRWAIWSGTADAVVAADILGLVALSSFFLVLRIADEHKDATVDVVAHPDRVLSTGRTTLARLRALAVIALALQFAIVVGLDGGLGRIVLAWAAATLWGSLMSVEFFVPGWLRPRMMLYALLHLLVMPALMIWIAQIGAGDQPLPMSIWPIPLVGLAAGGAFEVARKLRAPGEEHPLVDTYTQRLGIRGAICLLAAVLVAVCALLSLLLLRHAGGERVGTIAAAAIAVTWLVHLPAFAALRTFLRERTAHRAKAAEVRVGAGLMGGFLVQILFQIALWKMT